MLTVYKKITASQNIAKVLLERAHKLELSFAARQKNQLQAHLNDGTEISILLEPPQVLHEGDVLLSESNEMIQVCAASEPVMIIWATQKLDLMRAAYYLGSHHVPLEIAVGILKMYPDPVLAETLRNMGLKVDEGVMPFEPESAIHNGQQSHGQSHANTGAACHVPAHLTLALHQHVHDEHCAHHH